MYKFGFKIRLELTSDTSDESYVLDTIDYSDIDMGCMKDWHTLNDFTGGYTSPVAIAGIRKYCREHYGFDDSEVDINVVYKDGKLEVHVVSKSAFTEKRNIFGNSVNLTLLDCIKMFINEKIADGLLDDLGLCVYNDKAYCIRCGSLETDEPTDGEFNHCFFLTK